MDNGATIKIKSFQTLTWSEPFNYQDPETGEERSGMRQVILLYVQGEDGILYEYANGGWLGLPIDKDHMRKIDPPIPPPIKRRMTR